MFYFHHRMCYNYGSTSRKLSRMPGLAPSPALPQEPGHTAAPLHCACTGKKLNLCPCLSTGEGGEAAAATLTPLGGPKYQSTASIQRLSSFRRQGWVLTSVMLVGNIASLEKGTLSSVWPILVAVPQTEQTSSLLAGTTLIIARRIHF